MNGGRKCNDGDGDDDSSSSFGSFHSVASVLREEDEEDKGEVELEEGGSSSSFAVASPKELGEAPEGDDSRPGRRRGPGIGGGGGRNNGAGGGGGVVGGGEGERKILRGRGFPPEEGGGSSPSSPSPRPPSPGGIIVPGAVIPDGGGDGGGTSGWSPSPAANLEERAVDVNDDDDELDSGFAPLSSSLLFCSAHSVMLNNADAVTGTENGTTIPPPSTSTSTSPRSRSNRDPRGAGGDPAAAAAFVMIRDGGGGGGPATRKDDHGRALDLEGGGECSVEPSSPAASPGGARGSTTANGGRGAAAAPDDRAVAGGCDPAGAGNARDGSDRDGFDHSDGAVQVPNRPPRRRCNTGTSSGSGTGASLWSAGGGDARPRVLSLSFNQRKDCVALGTDAGYRVRTVPPVIRPIRRRRSHEDDGRVAVHDGPLPGCGGVTCCRMLNRTSLLAVVTGDRPRCLRLVNSLAPPRGSSGSSRVAVAPPPPPLAELHFTAAVRRAEMNGMRLVVLTADGRLHVFDLRGGGGGGHGGVTLIQSIGPIMATAGGIPAGSSPVATRRLMSAGAGAAGGSSGLPQRYFDLSVHHPDECWLAYGSGTEVGGVVLVDAGTGGPGSRPRPPGDGRGALRLVGRVKAHNHAICSIAIGGPRGGQHMATSSQKGTVIRVFALPRCEKLHTLWRGSSPCTIFSMGFNDSAGRLAVTGSSGTVHVYSLHRVDDKCSVAGACGGRSSLADNASASIDGGAAAPSPSPPDAKGASRGRRLLRALAPGSVADKTDSLRSFARVRIRPEKVGGPVPRSTLALVESGDDGEEDCLMVVTDEGRMYQFMIKANGAATPAGAEDLLLCDDSAEVGNGIVLDD